MTFLELVQALHQEGGVAGAVATTVAPSGETARLVSWINKAWLELQTMHSDWGWMFRSALLGSGCSFATVAGDATYPLGTGAGTCEVAVADFGAWEEGSFRCHTTAVGFNDEQEMGPISYEIWETSYMMGAQRSSYSRPYVIAVAPDKTLCVGPPALAGFTITGNYYAKATEMAGDDDEPEGLPSEYHMIIVYYALLKYGMYEAAPEVLRRSEIEYKRLYYPLLKTRRSRITLGGALA